MVFQWVRDMSCCICKAHRNFALPQAFELVPKDHALYERRGLVYRDQGEYERALVDFEKASYCARRLRAALPTGCSSENLIMILPCWESSSCDRGSCRHRP